MLRKGLPDKAFTLLELMMTTLIVVIMAALAIPRFQNAMYQAKFAEVFNTVGMIARAKQIFYAQHGSYEGDPPYTQNDCYAGNGTSDGSTLVQQDLNLAIPSNSFFMYMVYPRDAYPAATNIYFKEPGYQWAWDYNYVTNIWSVYSYGSADGGRARELFSPPN